MDIAFSFLQDIAMRLPLQWLIRYLVLTSMFLQIILVVFGGGRHRNSSRLLRLIVWVAYIAADAVAISALSAMTQSVGTRLHGLWAPLLLLHLGGPDTITAYSMADKLHSHNELWLRQGFSMVYQILVAVYVIVVTGIEGYLLLAALLLFVAGATKCGERTVALHRASYSQIVKSCLPIYKFMQYEADIAIDCGERTVALHRASYSQILKSCLPIYKFMHYEADIAIDLSKDREEYSYLVAGEKQLYKKLLELQRQDERKGFNKWKSLLKAKEIVTISDVWKHEGRETTDNYMLCLSHALFKMYKRRFVGLCFHEGDRRKTRKLFMGGHLSCDQVFRIADMELKFLYDAFFSKSSGTAYSGFGVLLRLFNTCFLGVACFLTFRGGKDDRLFKHSQGTVTYVLISVAIVLEVYQLCRIIVSDWTMVCLICRETQHLRLRQQVFHGYISKLVQLAVRIVRLLRSVRGDHYGKNEIGQYCVFDACSNRCQFVRNVAELFRMRNSIVMQWYVNAKYTKSVRVEDNFKRFIFDKLKERCSPDEPIGICRERVYAYAQCFSTIDCEDLMWASQLELEELILTWHIATVICEEEARKESDSPQNDDVSHCGTISRYCAYLLISQPHLLPLHADIAQMNYMELHSEILKHKGYTTQQWKFYKSEGKTTLRFGTKLARKLLAKPFETRWDLLGEFWAGLLIYIAVHNKAGFHAECLTSGGEFLTQLWLLVGHMVCGEQSDSAITKKVEEESKAEKKEDVKAEDARRRKQREPDKKLTRRRMKRDEEKQRRRIVEDLRVYEGSKDKIFNGIVRQLSI